MLTREAILEQITEALKLTRRYGTQKPPKFPTVFDLSCIIWNNDLSRIEMDLLDGGKVRKFNLMLVEVLERESDGDSGPTNDDS